MNKAILIGINMFGAVCMVLGLIVPFVTNVTEELTLGAFFLVSGFTLWYFSYKAMGGVK